MKLHAHHILRTALAAAAVGVACPAGADFDPFEMPRDLFEKTVRTLAMAPTGLPPGTVDQDQLRQSLERAVLQQLEWRGYAVIPSATFRERWTNYSEKLGGVFDPVTGDTLVDIHKTAFEYAARDLQKRDGANAVVFTWVAIATLPVFEAPSFFSRGFVAANSEPILWNGRPLGHRPQAVLGTRLNLRVDNLAGDTMFGISFPIEITTIYADSGYWEKPPGERFRNPSWIEKSVRGVTEKLPVVEGARKLPTRPPE